MNPEISQNLASLKSIADAARLKYAQAAAQHKTNSLSVSKLHTDMKEARDAWTQAYKAAGITRQRAWQLSRMAAGKCRTCGKTSATTNCPKCREKMRKAYAKRGEKLVQP